MYTCPVCFFDGLRYPPADYTICPSCYTEFGIDDAELSHEQLRRLWVEKGYPWMAANVMPPPPGWDGFRQLHTPGETAAEEVVAINSPHLINVWGSMTTTIAGMGRDAISLLSRIHPTSADLTV